MNPVTHLDLYTSTLTKIVLEGIEASVTLAKSCQYNKRWWTKELSSLCKKYTHLRNQSQRYQRNRYGNNPPLDWAAKAAKREYHSALQKQKKQHWEEFLDEPGNIWDICRYINSNSSQANFALISELQTSITTKATTNAEIAQGFLTEFFPPLPAYPSISILPS